MDSVDQPKPENCENTNSQSYLETLQGSEASQVISCCLDRITEKGDGATLGNSDGVTLSVAVASLQLFVEQNWTGPGNFSLEKLQRICSLDEKGYAEAHKNALSQLAVDGETVYEGIVFPLLLSIARHLLSHEEEMERKSPDWLLWQLRAVAVHQVMLGEKCDSLKRAAMNCITQLMSLGEDSTGLGDKDFEMGWRVEAATLSRFYFEHQTCVTLLNEALTCSQLNVCLDGVKGKRTRYQQQSIPQLVLQVQRMSSDFPEVNSLETADSSSLVCPFRETHAVSKVPTVPRNELMHDDTVLDKMETEGAKISPVNLNWVEQCLVLALCEEKRYVKGADTEITDEETSAYLAFVLSSPSDWSVQCKALFMRSLIEKKSGRRVERSLRQLEELCSLNTKSEPCESERLRGVYTSGLPPIWQLKKSLGELQMEIGAYASALEIFDRLFLYEPLILCCQRSGRLGKAEELIRARILIQESSTLYCSLADVTGQEQYYLKAWEFSGNRSARAMRGLAYHHLRACNYEEAMKCFKKTLDINPLQLPCWFSYGCSCLAAAEYEQAATAFRRCVMLEEDNFEAWNNLAAAYVRSNQKQRAFTVLQDAIKCSFDNWKIWENYTVIGCDCGQVAEVIQGAHRILDLTGKWQDEQVIEHLTKLVIQDVPDGRGRPSSCHREALLKLFGHATSKVTSCCVLWRSYGSLILTSKENSSDNVERGIQCLQKAYRCSINGANWEKSEEKCVVATDVLLELIDSYMLLDNKKYLSTGRLQVKSHISRLVKSYTDPVTKEVTNENVSNLLKALNASLLTLSGALS
ncbi:tetratricopeptide repeat protein 27-like [Watersipora subatra]|uniref:tetratricopeptide repeat protein 27-like n=1 Tax=Watersipora subatra TaxID=2589382 RepID=UPI00355BD0B4